MELRWWLLAFGSQVEVVKPEALRAELRAEIAAMARRYAVAGRRGHEG